MKQTIRAFIAVELPDDVKTALGQISQRLASQMPPGVARWVKPKRMHLTLRFLGDTAVSQLPAINQHLDDVAVRQAPFTLHLDDLGCFPSRKRPRVIWVGLAGDETTLLALKQDLDDGLVPLGWEREKRPFRAHLTLARVKDGRKLSGIQWGTEVEQVVMPVTAVHLIESQLRPTGPIYTIRHTSRLQDKT